MAILFNREFTAEIDNIGADKQVYSINKAIYGYLIGEDEFLAGHSTQNTPRQLKRLISDWDGSYEIDLREILGI